MLLGRWLTSVLGIGCSGPPPTRRIVRVECNHSEMHRHDIVQGLETSFPGDMAQVALTKVTPHDYVGMFHCCFCPPGHHDNNDNNNNNNDDNDEDWFNITTWESELTHWAQEIWDEVEHCAIVIEPRATISSL